MRYVMFMVCSICTIFLSGVRGVNNDQTKSEAGWAAGMTVPGIVSDLTSRSQGAQVQSTANIVRRKLHVEVPG